jgi:hypothetical protein
MRGRWVIILNILNLIGRFFKFGMETSMSIEEQSSLLSRQCNPEFWKSLPGKNNA